MVKVEFQLEKEPEFIYWDGDNDQFILTNGWVGTTNNNINISGTMVTDTAVSNSTDRGATVGGSHSGQQFHKTEIELEDQKWVVEIELRGVYR